MPINKELLLSVEQNRFADKKLSLIDNDLTDIDIVMLVDALKRNSYKGIEFLARNNSLLYLNLKSNPFSIESSRFLLKNYLNNIGFIFTRTEEFILELLKKTTYTELHSTKFVSFSKNILK